jgi:hypothetical protein
MGGVHDVIVRLEIELAVRIRGAFFFLGTKGGLAGRHHRDPFLSTIDIRIRRQTRATHRNRCGATIQPRFESAGAPSEDRTPEFGGAWTGFRAIREAERYAAWRAFLGLPTPAPYHKIRQL